MWNAWAIRGLAGMLVFQSACALTGVAPPPPGPTGERMKMIAESNNEFAIALYGRVGSGGGNLFLSPASVSTALAMTYAGARGQTAEEMKQTLRWTLDGDELHAAMAELTELVSADEEGQRLSVANALWGQQGFEFRDEFLALGREHYGAGLRKVDFKGATEEARNTINRWIEEKTHDKIRELLRPGMIDALTRLVLTNAIHFKGTWKTQFDSEETRKEPFRISAERSVSTEMMRLRDATVSYAEGPGYQVVELPYTGEATSMVVLLPDESSGLDELERELSLTVLEDRIAGLRPRSLDLVAVPRFKVTGELQLGALLREMGMRTAFGNGADFSGMTESQDLALSDVIHKAFVEVNEEGTEAAAATAVVVRVTSVQEPLVFRADRPFLFLIRHRESGAILFMGRVADPTRG